jgi:hypothetical protein
MDEYFDYLNGPDEIDRLAQINKLAYTTVNPTEEDFYHWEYFLFLVQVNKDNLIIKNYIEVVKNDMIRVCSAYGDYQYKKLLEEKID